MDLARRKLRQREWRRADQATAAAEDFNRKKPVGTKVKYSSIIGRESEYDVIGETRSEAWAVSGEAVVLITGKAGCVSLAHLTICNAAEV